MHDLQTLPVVIVEGKKTTPAKLLFETEMGRRWPIC